MKCLVCKTLENDLILSGYHGKVYAPLGEIFKKEDIERVRKNPAFDIYDCKRCGVRFAHPSPHFDEVASDYEDYETLYPGLKLFCEGLKKTEDPIWSIMARGRPYYAVFEQMREKSPLKILDVGCGYGYLAWTLATQGHDVRGIEISGSAVKTAQEIFGTLGFFKITVEEFLEKYPYEKFDLVTVVEVIEHTSNPSEFFQNCLGLLKPRGFLLITTPNLDYYLDRFQKQGIWYTEEPPIHLSLFTRKTLDYLAEDNDLFIRHIEFPGKLPSSTIAAKFHRFYEKNP